MTEVTCKVGGVVVELDKGLENYTETIKTKMMKKNLKQMASRANIASNRQVIDDS